MTLTDKTAAKSLPFLAPKPLCYIMRGCQLCLCFGNASEKFLSYIRCSYPDVSTRASRAARSESLSSVETHLIKMIVLNAQRKLQTQFAISRDVTKLPISSAGQLCPHKPLSRGELRGWCGANWRRDNEEKRGHADGMSIPVTRVSNGKGGWADLIL